MSNITLVDGHFKHFQTAEQKTKTQKIDKKEVSPLPKISLVKDHKLCVKIESPSSGFRGIGRSHEVVELVLDANYRILARYRNIAKRGGRTRRLSPVDNDIPSFGWTVLGRLVLRSNGNMEETV